MSPLPSAVKPRSGSVTGRAGFGREKAQETQKRRGRLGEDPSSKTEINPARPFYLHSVCPLWGALLLYRRPYRTIRAGDGPIRPTLQKTTHATKRARRFDNNIEDRNIGSAEQAGPIFLSLYFCRKSSSSPPSCQPAAVCSVGRIGPSPSPSHLFESARLHSHPLLITPDRGSRGPSHSSSRKE